jgi:hypothetical protein
MILDLLERNDEFNSLHSDEAQQSSLVFKILKQNASNIANGD